MTRPGVPCQCHGLQRRRSRCGIDRVIRIPLARAGGELDWSSWFIRGMHSAGGQRSNFSLTQRNEMAKGPNLRPSKAKQAARQTQSSDDDEEEKPSGQQTTLLAKLKSVFPDPIALLTGISVVFMVGTLSLVLWVNYTGDIDIVINEISRDIEVLETEKDLPPPHSSKRKDRDDLSESYAAIEAIERALQHGDTAQARRIASQLASSKTVSAEDLSGLYKTIDEAEAANPVADAGGCRPDDVLPWIRESGGIAEGIAVVDTERGQGDGRGRGLAATQNNKPGTRLLSVPSDLFMSMWTAERSETLRPILAEQASILHSFNTLALFLLHESHNETSFYRRYICSLPLHVPLPLLWEESELPDDFMANSEMVEGRRLARTLVDRSYNATVLPLLELYPSILPAHHFTPAKWAWACSIILSRAVAMRRPPPSPDGGPAGPAELESGEQSASLAWILEVLAGIPLKASGPQLAHVLIPGIDMLNHDSDPARAAQLSSDLSSGGAVVLSAGPGGAKRGREVLIAYGPEDAMCGSRPLNRYGFVAADCPGTAEAAQAGAGTGGPDGAGAGATDAPGGA